MHIILVSVGYRISQKVVLKLEISSNEFEFPSKTDFFFNGKYDIIIGPKLTCAPLSYALYLVNTL